MTRLRSIHATARPTRLRRVLRRFGLSEAGTSTVEFVFLFPAIFMLFGTTLEAGMYSMQQVMLERGLDMTVREVRLGIMADPDHAKMVTATCRYAVILNDCTSQLRLEMIKTNPVNFKAPSGKVPCIDAVKDPTDLLIVPGKNNDLMILRVCVRLKPLLPLAAMGRALTDDGTSSYYALSATTSFVMEPFQTNLPAGSGSSS